MNRSKLIKVSLFFLVTIVFLSCAVNANAWGHRRRVTYRPLSDYTKNNPSVFYWWYGPAPNYEYRLDLANYLPFGEGTPPPRGTYWGYIKERKLPDGRAEVTVYLTLHGAPFSLWDWREGNLVMEGKICWYWEIEKFIIEKPGADIPFLLDVVYPDDYLVISGCGMGYGIFTEFAEGFGYTPGEKGMFFMYQYCYIEDGIDYWTHEIHEMWEL
jgi:hypothetical protein